jgi:hypothetical protein
MQNGEKEMFSYQPQAMYYQQKTSDQIIADLLALNQHLLISLDQANATIVDQNHKLKVKSGIIRSHAQKITEAKIETQVAKDDLEGARVVHHVINEKRRVRITDLTLEVKQLQAKIVELEKNREAEENNEPESEKQFVVMQPVSGNALFNRRKAESKTEKEFRVPFVNR